MVPPEDEPMPDGFRQDEGENALGVVESRIHPRTPVQALAYIELSDDNGGLILNISEDGIAVQAVQVLASDYFPRMRFRLPKTEVSIEAAGRMVWQLRLKKEAGIRFVNLSDEARSQIQQWIAAEPSRLASAFEPCVRGAAPRETAVTPSAVSTEVLPETPTPVATVPLPVTQVPASAKPVPQAPAASLQLQPLVITARNLPADLALPGPSVTLASPEPVPLRQPIPSPSIERVPEPPQPQAPIARTPPAIPATPESPTPAAYAPRFPNMQQWIGQTPPGAALKLKDPRRWWTYTAALGIVAAIGFGALILLDPGTLSRVRLPSSPSQSDSASSSASSSQPEAARNVPGASGSSLPSRPQQPPTSRANSGIAAGHGAPQNLPAQVSAAHSSADGGVPVRQGLAAASSGGTNQVTSRQTHPQTNLNSSAVPNEGATSRTSQPQTIAPIPATDTQRTPAPARSSNSSAAPVNANPPTTQKDQDAHASVAQPNQDAFATNRSNPVQPSAISSPPRAPSVEAAKTESSPVVPSVPLSGVPSGSVAATSQFHAIRIPPKMQSKASQVAGNLQIGQLISSFSPAYPIEAAREGVEGIVKLDVIVGPNGAVESAQVLSGPTSLTDACVSAVKQWRYSGTSLGGNPIEAEQYVTIVFRLSKPVSTR